MKQLVSTRIILSARNFLKQEFAKPEIDLSNLKIYSIVYPSKNLPDKFILIKEAGVLRDIGNPDVSGRLEFCVYAKNLIQGDDQNQPNLEGLMELTEKVKNILDDAIFDNTAIASISEQTVNDSNIRYFYNSIVCETFNIKNKK